MLRSRNLGRFCAIVTALSFLLTGAFVCASQSGLIEKASAEGYSKRLFDASRVHSIDIAMDDWETFIENCAGEEYVSCTVLIDGEKYSNVAIRAKGNTSLSMVASSDSDRYSFKVKFDEYVDGQTCYGLDKLVLNNNYSDATMMKEAVVYDMFAFLDVDASLYNYARISVNGEYWGVYLALEAVEESFALRNYGTHYGNLYKPDSMEMGGAGRMKDVDLDQIARTTAGFTGADLENLMNEAAIAAARKGHVFIRQKDIKNAFIKVGIGAEKKSKVISEKEKRITAYHEAGHAILFHVLPDMEPVYTISIIPTGMGAAGYTMPLPENDEIFNTKGKMLQDITTLLGGRVAEELIFGDITTGASNDIKRATSEARAMVTKYGMSDKIGLISYGDDDDEVFIGRDLAHTRGYSEDVAKAIDSEIHSIIEECHDNAKKIISEHMEVLHGCAKLLLEKEKVHRDEFEALFTMEKSGESNESI